MRFLIFMIVVVLLCDAIGYARNLVYARRLHVLEELLNSKLRCTFGPLLSTVEAKGIYRGRSVRFKSYPTGLWRMSMFILKSSKLPMQKKFMFTYPQVAQDISQEGDMLVRRVGDLFTWQLAAIGRKGIAEILDALVDNAEKLEDARFGSMA